MNKPPPYLILIIFLLFTSCQPMLRLVAGVKSPGFESNESISNTAEELNIPLKDLYVFRNDSLYKEFDTTQLHLDVIDRVLCFNKNGYLLVQDTSLLRNSCVIPGSNFVDLLLTVYKVDSSLQLNNYLQTLKRMKAQDHSAAKQADITMIYHWGIWYKGLVKNRIKEINEVIKTKNDSINVELMYVNTDLNRQFYPRELLDKNPKIRFRN